MSDRSSPVLVGLLAAASCAPTPEVEPTGWSLLSRPPDAVLDQPGRLTPDPEAAWGPANAYGWEQRTSERDGLA